MTPDEATELGRLLDALADGPVAPADAARLSELLQTGPAAQDLYLAHMGLHGLLEWETGQAPAPAVLPLAPDPPGRSRWSWRAAGPLAAGLLLGVASTSLVWALEGGLGRPRETALPVADAGFEAAVPPTSDGLPARAGAWGGDFAAIVEAEQGVAPHGGRRMLRFLRSDFRGEKSDRSYVGNLLQVVDVRPWQAQFADGAASVELAAWFNAVPAGPGEAYFAGVQMYAVAADPAEPHPPTTDWLRDRCLASCGRQHAPLDADPTTWQQVAAGMPLPPGTDFLVVEVKVARLRPEPTAEPVQFPGHYVDDVTLTLKRPR